MQTQTKPRPYKVNPSKSSDIHHGVLIEDGLPVQNADATYKTACGQRVPGERVVPESFFGTDRQCRRCLESIRIDIRLGKAQQ